MAPWLISGLYHVALMLGAIVAGIAFLGLFLYRIGRDPIAGRYDPIALLAAVGMASAAVAVFGFW